MPHNLFLTHQNFLEDHLMPLERQVYLLLRPRYHRPLLHIHHLPIHRLNHLLQVPKRFHLHRWKLLRQKMNHFH
jgi:hypothetical protein